MSTRTGLRLISPCLCIFSFLTVVAAAPEVLDCSSKFSADYYGLGVRLGIYFAWTSSWIANNFIEEEISGNLDANSIFLLALIVAMFNASIWHTMAFIDGLILMQLSAGYLFGCLSIWGYRTLRYHTAGPEAISNFGNFGTHCRLICVTAISGYGVWFWIEGVEDGLIIATNDSNETRPDECYPIVTYFFGTFPIRGGIRTLYIIMSCGCTFYFGLMIIAAILERGRHLTKWFSRDGNKRHVGHHRAVYETGFTHKELSIIFWLLRGLNLAWIIFSAVMVEVTLNKNKITGVLGSSINEGGIAYPAQLLPMLIGALSLVRILFLLYRQWSRSKEAKEGNARKEFATKLGTSPQSPQVSRYTTGGGLGLHTTLSPTEHSFSPSAVSEGTTVVSPGQDHSSSFDRPRYLRYLVAWLPWLSVYDLWTNPNGGHARLPDMEDDSRGSPLLNMRTAYRPTDEMDAQMQSVPSSSLTPPSPWKRFHKKR